ncbi:hypothetical protein TeGR_g10103, partial [Tetraparma gracilis]
YDAGGHNRLVGSLMALNAINADPDILPNTKLVFEYIDSKREAGSSVQGALAHVTDSFAGTGADVVVGPASSGPSMAAQRLLGANGIPQMSYSASSPDLSDAAEYPTFFRTVASDAFQGKAVANFLKDDLEYTNVCVVTSVDSYSAKGAAAFIDAAGDIGMTIVKTVELSEDGTTEGSEDAVALIADSQCRVVFMMTQAAPAGMFIRSAAKAGIMGPDSGWLWVLADAIAGSLPSVAATAIMDGNYTVTTMVKGEAETSSVIVPGIEDGDAFTALLIGSIGSIPLAPSGADYDQFLVDYEAQASTAGTCGAAPAELTDDCACDQTKDSAGNLLFQRDHDEDPATPDMCAGFNYAGEDAFAPNSYAYYAYDAVYAFARAAHELVETDGKTSFEGSNIIDKLKSMDGFQGVTGMIEFETNGDREVGTGFTIQNHDGTGFNDLGNWDKSTGLTYGDEVSVETIVFSSGVGSDFKPANKVLKMCTPDDIDVVVEEECSSSSKRIASFAVKVDVDGEPICEEGNAPGQSPPADVELDCEYSPADSAAGFLAYILGIVGFGLCIVWMLWVAMNMNNKVIKVAQPVFCISFAFAAAVVSVSNIFFVGKNTSGMCFLRPWIFNIFFDIMFGSLFLKTFRVYKIFGNKSLSKVKVSSFDVFKTYFVVLLVDVALLAGWVGMEGMEAVTNTNVLESYWTYETVECNSAEMFEFATTFFKILMVLAGVYLSWITRNVPDKFAESKWIALSIYQVFILGVVGLLVKMSSPKSLLLVQGIAVPVACIATCTCIFAPKLMMIKNPEAYEDNLKTSQNTSAGGGSGSGRSEQEYEELLAKIQDLEEENAKLKDGQ